MLSYRNYRRPECDGLGKEANDRQSEKYRHRTPTPRLRHYQTDNALRKLGNQYNSYEFPPMLAEYDNCLVQYPGQRLRRPRRTRLVGLGVLVNHNALHTPALLRAAAIVRNWSNVTNARDEDPRRAQCSYGRFTPGSWTSDECLDLSEAMIHSLAGNVFTGPLGRERRGLP
jgi:hypothetical protein